LGIPPGQCFGLLGINGAGRFLWVSKEACFWFFGTNNSLQHAIGFVYDRKDNDYGHVDG
jgi:hypothetical protein